MLFLKELYNRFFFNFNSLYHFNEIFNNAILLPNNKMHFLIVFVFFFFKLYSCYSALAIWLSHMALKICLQKNCSLWSLWMTFVGSIYLFKLNGKLENLIYKIWINELQQAKRWDLLWGPPNSVTSRFLFVGSKHRHTFLCTIDERASLNETPARLSNSTSLRG